MRDVHPSCGFSRLNLPPPRSPGAVSLSLCTDASHARYPRNLQLPSGMNESPSAARAFLGVERSVLGRPWRGRLDAAGEARGLALAQGSWNWGLFFRVFRG